MLDGHLDGRGQIKDSSLLPIHTDHADFACTNASVDAVLRLRGSVARERAVQVTASGWRCIMRRVRPLLSVTSDMDIGWRELFGQA